MKFLVYIAALAFSIVSCSTARNYTMEDDIYFVPGEKALVVKEVEELTGQDIHTLSANDVYTDESSRSAGSTTAPAAFTKSQTQVINTQTGQLENVDMSALTTEAQQMLANNPEINATIYENTGYWIGGYKGNAHDLPEIQRIINMYPQGFAYFNGNGADIAINLSFDPDWNVYTDNGRYWWFPSSSNINLYSSLIFGTYPKYIWTVIWDNPRFDTWAFNSSFNSGFNLGLNVGWAGPSWSVGFGWNSGWYDPWYRPWYGGWYDPWYDPWYRPWYGYYPGWGHPHWHHPHWDRPHWGGDHYYPHRPSRPGIAVRPGTTRPGVGNHISGVRPGTSARPGTSTARPSTGVRPGTSASIRPGTTTRPSTTTRPGTTTRPSTITRPNTSTTRPSTITRPNTTTRPGTTTRPSTYHPTGNDHATVDGYASGYNDKTVNNNSTGNDHPAVNSHSSGNHDAAINNDPSRHYDQTIDHHPAEYGQSPVDNEQIYSSCDIYIHSALVFQ